MDLKKLLKVRSDTKASKPNFIRQRSTDGVGSANKVRVGSKYRKPKGYHSKMRLRLKGKAVMPSQGYRAPKAIRGTNAEGMQEVVIKCVADLEKVDSKTQCVVVGSSVGNKNRIAILEKAIELKLKTDVDAEATFARLKDVFEKAKKARADKKKARVKVAPEKPKPAKKAVKKAVRKPEAKDADSKADAEETKEKKEQEKILIDKKKAM